MLGKVGSQFLMFADEKGVGSFSTRAVVRKDPERDSWEMVCVAFSSDIVKPLENGIFRSCK